jgi:hypothetical protein
MTDRLYRTCQTCREYGEARMSTLVPAMAARRAETGETSEQILDRYMNGVHERHMSGLPVLPVAS